MVMFFVDRMYLVSILKLFIHLYALRIRINSFTRPASSIVVNPGSGITWSLTNAGVSGHGDFHYTYRKFL